MLILFILNQVSLDFLLCPTCVCSITNGCYRPYKTWETGRRLIQAWSVFWHRYDSWLHIRRTAEQTLWVSVTVCIINSSTGVKPTWATIDSLTEPKEIKKHLWFRKTFWLRLEYCAFMKHGIQSLCVFTKSVPHTAPLLCISQGEVYCMFWYCRECLQLAVGFKVHPQKYKSWNNQRQHYR